MKVVVFGGAGRIGSKVAAILRERNDEVFAPSSSKVDVLTGRGLQDALEEAQVVIDLTNSSSSDDTTVMTFFQNSARHLLTAEIAAGVQHHIALSIVGVDRMVNLGYMRAKLAQEEAIRAAGISHTIVRSTQFFEFLGHLADFATKDQTVTVSNVLMQPIAADDIASAVASLALQLPRNRCIDVAGPERHRLDELLRGLLRANRDLRQVVTDPTLGYFGGKVPENALVPDRDALLGTTRFSDWLKRELFKYPDELPT